MQVLQNKMLSMDVSISSDGFLGPEVALANYTATDLDGAHVQYSYKHSTLVTLTVDGSNGQRNNAPQSESQEWHLATFDPRNENKYMYKLHTLDIYFWAKEDALQFVNGVRRVLPQQQVAVHDEPVAPLPHHDDMSPVVQNLENVAITDPSYQQGRTRDSRNTTTSFQGPPISATPQSQEASNFAPLAYNPAAPAAPEAIKFREKTPPPQDGAANPLVAAATSDQGQTYGVPYQGFSGPPSQPHQPQSYFTGPPPSAVLQSPYAGHFQNSFAPPPTANSTDPYATARNPPPGPPAYQQQAPHIPVTQYANYPGSPGISSAMTTPGIYSPGFTSPQQTPGISSPNAPPGGFAQFSYGAQQQQISSMQPLVNDYSIHQQVYRPTEAEAGFKHKPLKAPTGKLEQRAGQLENRVGSLLKRLEKKVG
jgi:hypothetical protein